MTLAWVPLSFWCGMSSRGGPQQSTAQGMVTCAPVMLQKASTSSDMQGVNPLPWGPSVCLLRPLLWSAHQYASSHCCSFQLPLLSFSHRNCPILRIEGAGRQVIDSEIAAINLHVAIRCWARANMASSLPSVRGCRSSHQAKSSSVYLVVLQSRSTSPHST